MKYLMEEKIDFFDELNKTVLNEEKNCFDESNICLISCEQLTNKYITMDCGHKFNYLPLFKDISNHKLKFNSMESRINHLKLDEIRCPYCRKKQTGILPYYEEFGLEKINGVNIINEIKNKESNLSYFNKYCIFIMNENENSLPCLIQDSTLKESFIPIYCNNNKMVKLDKDSKDIPWFCNVHKKVMIAKEKKEKKEKAKQEKLIIKLEMKKEKKNLEKNFSLSKVEELNNLIQEENEIIELPVLNSNNCKHILKSGSNKGKCCNNKIFLKELCKRHYIG